MRNMDFGGRTGRAPRGGGDVGGTAGGGAPVGAGGERMARSSDVVAGEKGNGPLHYCWVKSGLYSAPLFEGHFLGRERWTT